MRQAGLARLSHSILFSIYSRKKTNFATLKAKYILNSDKYNLT